MRRRRFIAAASALAATACLPASRGPEASASASASATTTPTPTPLPTTTPSPAPRPPDWDALRAALRGTLFQPSTGGYDDARLLYNTRFDAIRPLAIARCADERDVQACVRFARDSGVPLRVRSGGHSYAGWSTGSGLVIDLRALSAVALDGDSATIGAGAQLIDVYDGLAARGRGIAAGSCPSVGVGGLTLGGGIGVLTRAWGLTCDQLTSARIVLADGTAVTCDTNSEPDLFWALRGGGGSFGVVTSLTFATHAARDLALGIVNWPTVDAPPVLTAWQRWIQDAPDELWSNVHLSGGAGGVGVHAVASSSGAAISAQFDRLIALAGRTPWYRESGVRTFRDVMLLEAGCLGRTTAQCHLHGTTAEGVLQRETYAAKSIVAVGPFSDTAVARLVEHAYAPGAGDVLIDALGGAVARVAPDATAFPHRKASAVVQLLAGWRQGDDAGPPMVWLRDSYNALRPLIGSAAYANYTDADLADWPAAYYGSNYPRLQRIKRRYDPDRLFDFPQAVTPA